MPIKKGHTYAATKQNLTDKIEQNLTFHDAQTEE